MDQDDMLHETYRLSLENNKMLHRMRRNAFMSSVFTLLWWAVLLGIPIWLYLTYLFPVVQQLQNTVGKIQGTGAAAELQVNNLENAWQQFKSKFTPGTTTSQ